jgi:hypothetical protein
MKENFKSFMAIDPAMAALVQRIVWNTGCEIVLSSSWRLSQNGRDEIERKICKFADVIPILYGPADMRSKYGSRGILRSNIMRFWTMPEASFPSNERISFKRHGKVV